MRTHLDQPRGLYPSPWTDGWYPDPWRRAPYRQWTGQDWTQWVSDGTTVWVDALAWRRPLTQSDAEGLCFVSEVFLPEAAARRIVGRAQAERFLRLIDDLSAEARGTFPLAPAASAATTTPTASAGDGARTPVAASLATATATATTTAPPAPVTRPAPPLPVTPPAAVPAWASSRGAEWRRRAREAIRSDLAVHGLAYLGVLLFFVGVFGLVAFAFGEFGSGLRPVVECLIAVVPLAAAALLLRRDAVVVGRALEVLGGMLLPLVLMTTVLDGVSVPPDLTGPGLVVALTVMCGAVAVAYAGWSRRHPASGLRFLVAPMVMLAVAMATLGVGRTIPSGEDVAVPASGQVAAVAGALVVSLALLWLRPTARLAAPTITAALVGAAVLGPLAALTWGADGWPAVPVLISGVLLVAAVEMLAGRLPVGVIGVVEPLWWSAVGLALAPDFGPAPAATVAAIGFVALVELDAACGRPLWAVRLPAIGALVACAVSSTSPWWTFGLTAAATVWAMTRRLAPFDVPGATVALDVVAGLLPLTAVVALSRVTTASVAIVTAAGLALCATVPATRRVLRRDEDDRFWVFWWDAAVVGVTWAALEVWGTTASDGQRWLIAGAVAALAVVCALGPIVAVWRPWPVLVLAASAWLAACDLASTAPLARGVVMGAVALAVVGAAHYRPLVRDTAVAGSLGLAGHALAAVSLGAAGLGWGLTVTTGLLTAGWAVTMMVDLHDGSPVRAMLTYVGQWVQYVPCVLVAVGLPATASLALDASGALALDAVWAPSVPAAAAVIYAIATRMTLPPRLGATLAWVAFGAGVAGSVSGREPGPAALGLAALIAAVLVLDGARRVPLMTWVSWAAVAPLVGLLAVEVSPRFAAVADVTAAATTLAAVGGALVLAGAALDLRRGWVPRWAPRAAALRPVVAVGGVDVLVALVMALEAVPATVRPRLTIAIAGVFLGAGLLARAGLPAGVAAVLGWTATIGFSWTQIDHSPWIAAVVAGGLLVTADGLHRFVPDRQWWSRWDLPLLLAAVPVALTALTAAADGDWYAATFVGVGMECIAVAARLRRVLAVAAGLAPAGTALALLGAADAGDGWLALSLVLLSAALTVIANRTHGYLRRTCQMGAVVAALGAWSAGITWLAWSAQRSIDITAVLAGAVALAGTATAWTGRVARSWIQVVLGTSVVVTTAAALAAERSLWAASGALESVSPSGWVVGGLFLTTLASLVGAEPLRLRWLRDVGAVAALSTVAVTLQTAAAGPVLQVSVWLAISVECAAFVVMLPRLSIAAVWGRPSNELGVGALGAAVCAAALQLPDTSLLVPTLAVAALQAAAVGLALRLIALQALSPPLACASWLAFASEALTGDPQWITGPIGLAFILLVAVLRRDRASRGLALATPEIVSLEMIGIVFMVGASFVQAITETVAYTLVPLGVGCGIVAWGVLTKVRRRVAAGSTVVVASLVVLVAVPLVRLVPQWSSASLWLLIAGLGLAAVMAATTLEKGHAVGHERLRHVRDVTSDWE